MSNRSQREKCDRDNTLALTESTRHKKLMQIFIYFLNGIMAQNLQPCGCGKKDLPNVPQALVKDTTSKHY